MSKKIFEMIHLIERIKEHGQDCGDPQAITCCNKTIRSLKEFDKVCKNFHQQIK